MDTTPLPNQEDGSSDGGSFYEPSDFSNLYVIRLTPMEKYSLEDIKKYLTEMQAESWILAVETTPKLHYHIVLEHEEELEHVKQRIRSFLHVYWPKRERGWGNAQYNCQQSKEKLKAISYALKDRGEYYYDGYSQEYIDYAIMKSFPKKELKTFKTELYELNQCFQQGGQTLRQYIKSFLVLKARYGQQCHFHVALGYAQSAMIRLNEDFADEIIDKNLGKQ